MRRWSPKENAEIEGKFRGGWIELRGLPFHLWSEKGHLPALLEVTDGEWVFTVAVVVVGEEDCQEVTRDSGGRRRRKSDQRLEEDAVSRRIIGRERGERGMAGVGKGPEGTRPPLLRTAGPMRGRPRLHLSVALQLRKWTAVIKARRGWALAQEEMTQWRRRRRQELEMSLRCRSETLLSEKDKVVFDENPEGVALGADYLAGRGFSASPLFSRRYSRIWKHRLGERASTSQNEAALHNLYSDEYMEGFLGRVGSDPRGEQSWCNLVFNFSSPHLISRSFGSISPFLSPAAPLFPDQELGLESFGEPRKV
ncbi:hypothetical protein AAG906_015227 [Vitis piasezkii]